jgi:hypothetical protein
MISLVLSNFCVSEGANHSCCSYSTSPFYGICRLDAELLPLGIEMSRRVLAGMNSIHHHRSTTENVEEQTTLGIDREHHI